MAFCAKCEFFSSPHLALRTRFALCAKMPHSPHLAHKAPVMQAIHTIEKLGKYICLSSIPQLATKNQVFFFCVEQLQNTVRSKQKLARWLTSPEQVFKK